MNLNLWVAFAFTVVPVITLAQTSTAPPEEGVFAPGVQHVCVPTSDGEGWDCGTESAPPENYRAPEPETAEAAQTAPSAAESSESTASVASSGDTPPPPAFLMNPDRITPYAPPATEAPAMEAPVVAESTADPEPAVALPEPAPLPIGAPVEPVAVVPVETPVPIAAAVAAPVEPVVSAAEAAPVATSAPSSTTLGSADTFAQLPATSFTLQLAYADRTDGFASLVSALGLDPATCYVLRVRGSNGNTWLLAHGAFADIATARAAQAALPRVAGLSAQWPRRIGALQTELADSER